jgi:hypothetical protein
LKVEGAASNNCRAFSLPNFKEVTMPMPGALLFSGEVFEDLFPGGFNFRGRDGLPAAAQGRAHGAQLVKIAGAIPAHHQVQADSKFPEKAGARKLVCRDEPDDF